MGRGEKFLTVEQFDSVQLILSLKESIKKIEGKNKNILEEIIFDFEKKDYSILTPQEINWMKKNQSETWAEYLVYRHNFKNLPRKKILLDTPLHLLIEPISSCNLRCVMCFQIDESFTNNSEFMGRMKLDLFKKIIDDAVSSKIHAVTMASRGEPTLHPEFKEMLKYCKDKFFELKINSNATKLTDKLINSILDSGVTEMVFSIDSYTKENFEKIRKGGIFEVVLDNIKKFKTIREEKYPDSKCLTRVSGVRVDSDQDPIKFKEFWEKYVDEVVMVNMQHRWDTYHNSTEIMGNGPCHILWEKMYIWFDGTVNTCDEDYKSELSVGSIINSSIKELWNNDKYKQLRNKHLEDKRNTCFPCDRCPNGS